MVESYVCLGLLFHDSMRRLRSVFKLTWPAMVVLSLLAGCAQPVFVGMPTPTPEPIVRVPYTANAPVPPFGPRSFSRADFYPGAPPPDAVVPIATEPGPAFAWTDTENYLILGTDRRTKDDSWRTDTIIVVGIDRELERAAVLSIPRDLYLEIPNYGYARINQADYIGERITKVEGGGPALISTVLSRTLGISTKHWIRFEMTGFKSVVDAVGGVTVHLDCPFYEPILNLDTGNWEYFTLPAGPVHLDGESAYWFVRLRLRESDIGRSRRQRQFLWALRDQTLNSNLILRLPELWTAFQSSFSTDLTLFEMIELLRLGINLDPANVRASGITLRELQSYTTERGAAVLIIRDPARVQAVIGGIWDAPAMADANRQDSTACASLPAGVPDPSTETVTAPVAPAEAEQAANPEDAVDAAANRDDG